MSSHETQTTTGTEPNVGIASDVVLRLEDLPPLLTHGRSAFGALEPVYQPGVVKFSDRSLFFGYVGMASRHGSFPATVIMDDSWLTIVVKVTGSFHSLEHDVFNIPSTVVSDMFESIHRQQLYYETLLSGWADVFCDEDPKLSVLPRSCFVSIDSPCCLSCLVEADQVQVDLATKAWFDRILKGMTESTRGIMRTCESLPSTKFRVVLQRLEEDQTKSIETELEVNYDDSDNEYSENMGPVVLHASADAIRRVVQSSVAWFDQEYLAVKATTLDKLDTDMDIPCRPMPTSMCFKPHSTANVRITGNTEPHITLIEKITKVACMQPWEQRFVSIYLQSKDHSRGSIKDNISLALTLFTPHPVVIHRCRATNRMMLFQHQVDATEIDFEEAQRLVYRHSIVFGFDEQSYDVFRAVAKSSLVRAIRFRIADCVSTEVLKRAEEKSTDSSAHSHPLNKLKRALSVAHTDTLRSNQSDVPFSSAIGKMRRE